MAYPEILEAYRANPKNKYGATDYMETIPHKFDPKIIETFTRAAAAGTKYGVPELTPAQLANMALHEGREDYGFNELNKNNKRANEVANLLMKEGHDTEAAQFAGAILDKHQLAERLQQPFLQVWNGAGKMARDYAKNSQIESYAAEHPKNQGFLDFIQEQYNDAKPKPVNTMPFDPGPQTSFKHGGVVKAIKGNNKLI